MHRRRDIHRYVEAGLPPAAEARLRDHLSACDACRQYYDQQVVLLRSLAGNPEVPTRAEVLGAEARILSAAQSEAPAVLIARPGLFDRLLYARQSAVAVTAALLIAVSGGLAWRLLGPTPVIGTIEHVRAANVDGVMARKGTAVHEGQHIEVGDGGFAALQLARGGRLRLYSSSRLSVSDAGNAVGLDEGRVWCVIDAGGAGFTVTTREGTARVLGTSFVVERREQKTAVRVLEGSVEVEDSSGRGSVRVAARMQTRLRADAPPDPVTDYSGDEDPEEWQRLLGRILERLKQDVERGLDTLKKSFD